VIRNHLPSGEEEKATDFEKLSLLGSGAFFVSNLSEHSGRKTQISLGLLRQEALTVVMYVYKQNEVLFP
jgi:hypothetical protein